MKEGTEQNRGVAIICFAFVESRIVYFSYACAVAGDGHDQAHDGKVGKNDGFGIATSLSGGAKWSDDLSVHYVGAGARSITYVKLEGARDSKS